jgi:hypothetical protein
MHYVLSIKPVLTFNFYFHFRFSTKLQKKKNLERCKNTNRRLLSEQVSYLRFEVLSTVR